MLAMSLQYTTRPLSDPTWLRPPSKRESSQFTTGWSRALDLLGAEIRLLDGRDVVIEVGVRPQDLRTDGQVRANARPSLPAVVVAFDSKKRGPLLFRSDRYGYVRYGARMREPWQHNVYAVARTLEALRAVERYGVAESGEQYRGYAQIESAAKSMSALEAREYLIRVVSSPDGASWPDDRLVKRARREAHPDRMGSEHVWHKVQQAATILGVS